MNPIVYNTPVSLPEAAHRMSKNIWTTLLALGYEVLDVLYTGKMVFFCGNGYCNRVMTVNANGPADTRCRSCGQGFNWLGIKTRLMKKCALCSWKTSNLNDNFCPKHQPGLGPLKLTQVWINR